MEQGLFVVSHEFDFQVGKSYRHCVDMGEFILTDYYCYPDRMGRFARKRHDFEKPSDFLNRDRYVYPLHEMRPYQNQAPPRGRELSTSYRQIVDRINNQREKSEAAMCSKIKEWTIEIIPMQPETIIVSAQNNDGDEVYCKTFNAELLKTEVVDFFDYFYTGPETSGQKI